MRTKTWFYDNIIIRYFKFMEWRDEAYWKLVMGVLGLSDEHKKS